MRATAAVIISERGAENVLIKARPAGKKMEIILKCCATSHSSLRSWNMKAREKKRAEGETN
jgi:hypothetical protein